MDFGNLFQKLKHDKYKLTSKEREQVIAFLMKPTAAFDVEAHTAIYVLCLSSKPTAGNLALVEPFLADTVDDYVRAAAITGMFTIWDFFEEQHIAYLEDALRRILDDERLESSNAAFGAASRIMHARDRYDLSVAVERALDTLFEAAKPELENEKEFAAQNFISASLTLRNAWARSAGKRPTYFSSMDEALEVYRNKEAYLLQPVH